MFRYQRICLPCIHAAMERAFRGGFLLFCSVSMKGHKTSFPAHHSAFCSWRRSQRSLSDPGILVLDFLGFIIVRKKCLLLPKLRYFVRAQQNRLRYTFSFSLSHVWVCSTSSTSFYLLKHLLFIFFNWNVSSKNMGSFSCSLLGLKQCLIPNMYPVHFKGEKNLI